MNERSLTIVATRQEPARRPANGGAAGTVPSGIGGRNVRRRSQTGWQRTAVVIAGAAALLATSACGARWDEEQRAAVLAQSTGGDGTVTGPRTGAPGDPSTRTGVSTPTGQAQPGATTPGGGTTPAGAPVAGADPAVQGATADSPCRAPSDAPGVTDTEITLGTISTESGAVPGLGSSALAAAQAYIAYRNSTGGVCGRQLALRTADDGQDNGRHRAAVADMDAGVLGLVGGVGGGDAGSGEIVVERGIPVVVTAISQQYQDAATVFDINPPFADVNRPIGKFTHLHEQGVRRAALVYPAVDQTRSEILGKQRPQMEAAGIQVVLQHEYPLSTLSFDSAARAVANSGADYLLFLSDAGQSASMASAMAGTEHQVRFAEYVTAYGSNFIELAGEGAEGAISWTRTLPNEEPNNPEQQAFLEWMDQTAPGVVRDTFAADSWSAAKAMVDAIAALPGPITREAVLAQLRATATYDAGGLLGPIQLGPKLNNGCVVGMRVEGGQWRRFAPAEGFLC